MDKSEPVNTISLDLVSSGCPIIRYAGAIPE
jgi:hypothetical protein